MNIANNEAIMGIVASIKGTAEDVHSAVMRGTARLMEHRDALKSANDPALAPAIADIDKHIQKFQALTDDSAAKEDANEHPAS